MTVLDLDFLYARVVVESGEKPLEVFRAGPSHSTDEIAQSLDEWLNEDRIDRPSQTRHKVGDQEISNFSMRVGVEGNLGRIFCGVSQARLSGKNREAGALRSCESVSYRVATSSAPE
jgi:hypothetical protein